VFWLFGFLKFVERLCQLRPPHQKPVNLPCNPTPFVNGPDNEALATAAIPGGEDFWVGGGVFFKGGFECCCAGRARFSSFPDSRVEMSGDLLNFWI
jgi:hypothetical protein